MRAGTARRRPSWRTVAQWPAFPAMLLWATAFALDVALNPHLLSTNGLIGLSTSNLPLIAVALGQSLLLIGRHIDLSVGATISLTNVLAVRLFEAGLPAAGVLPLAFLAAVAMGLLNGLLVVRCAINPLLATFATSSVASGLALWLLSAPGGSIPIGFVTFLMGSVAGVPVALLAIAGLALLWIVLRRTVFMLHLYAVGGDRAKAFASGLPVQRIRFVSFLIASCFTGFAGLFVTFSIGSGDPLIGESYTLLSIAAPVIGGVAILGGSGDGLGSIFGALFLAIATELLLAFGVSPFYQQLVVGLIILAGLGGVVSLQRAIADWRARTVSRIRRDILRKA